jgi:hypothetical protein
MVLFLMSADFVDAVVASVVDFVKDDCEASYIVSKEGDRRIHLLCLQCVVS